MELRHSFWLPWCTLLLPAMLRAPAPAFKINYVSSNYLIILPFRPTVDLRPNPAPGKVSPPWENKKKAKNNVTVLDCNVIGFYFNPLIFSYLSHPIRIMKYYKTKLSSEDPPFWNPCVNKRMLWSSNPLEIDVACYLHFPAHFFPCGFQQLFSHSFVDLEIFYWCFWCLL